MKKKRSINYEIIFHYLGIMLSVYSIFIAIPGIVSIFYKENDFSSFFISALLTFFAGLVLYSFGNKGYEKLNFKESIIVIVSTPILLILTGSLPFLLSGTSKAYVDAAFEATSGITTTSATIFDNLDALTHGILLWRSLMQWIGGLIFILLVLIFLIYLGFSGSLMFVTEVTGHSKDRIRPRISDSAKRLILLYIGFSIFFSLAFRISGMNGFDAICHALATISTGGFSTHDAPIDQWNTPLTVWLFSIFMFISGISYFVLYFLLKFKFNKLWVHQEFRFHLKSIVIFSAIVTIALVNANIPFADSVRTALFNVASLFSTSGYSTIGYSAFGPFITMIFIILLFQGGSSGSPAGGVKMIRMNILINNSIVELKRIIHPNALMPIRYDNHVVMPQIISHIIAFSVLYIISLATSFLLLSSFGLEFNTALGSALTCLANNGINLDPSVLTNNVYSTFPFGAKVTLIATMLIGRMELFTIGILFFAKFWQK